MSYLIQDFILNAARNRPDAEALVYAGQRLTYAELASAVGNAAEVFLAAGLGGGERVAIYLEKRIETVIAMFGVAAAGGVFVPINPLLKAEQVAHILRDCEVGMLLTSVERFAPMQAVLQQCVGLRAVFVCGAKADTSNKANTADIAHTDGLMARCWAASAAPTSAPSLRPPHRRIDTDVAAILYTSGSTGKPKGVILSHRNLVAGATSVASYLELCAQDRVLAVLPLSFDYGLSQLTSAFHVGAAVVLLNYLLPRDIVDIVEAERVTGLSAVPPLWNQLAKLAWPQPSSLRYLTNSGGSMPLATIAALGAALPAAQLFLMYGLTEAFRSTYLPPSELARRPDSIGRAVPNADILVVRPDGTLCDDDEAGELVHRGALVALGYWNDAAKTAERFRPAPGSAAGLPLAEIAVWSGDTVRRDKEGYLYFIARNDALIKVSGYRISPTEIEEVAYASGLVEEAVAFGVPHAQLGQAIVLLAVASGAANADAEQLLMVCRRQLPAFMVPAHVGLRSTQFPRNPNGKIDRARLQRQYLSQLEEAAAP